MSLGITKDCFPPAHKCHNCLRKTPNEVRKKPAAAAVKDYKRCGNCHLFSYCDRDCQRDHWDKVHKHRCRFLSGKAPVKNSEHNAATCARCIEERESSPIQLRSRDSPKTVCNIEADATVMKKKLSEDFGFHEEGKKGHCSVEFALELPFPLEEVSGQYVEKGSTGLDAMLAHTLKILRAMFIKAQEEDHKNALQMLWGDIICYRSRLWYDILVTGMPRFRPIKDLSDQIDGLKSIFGVSNPWWKSLTFTVDFVLKTKENLMSTLIHSHSLKDPRFQNIKLLLDYHQSQVQIQAMVCEKQMWTNFLLWPTLVNGSLAVLLPPSTRCHSCYAELGGSDFNSQSLPCLLPYVGDNGALMACCPVIQNPNCRNDCLFKSVAVRMQSDEDQWKEFLKEHELFSIESRDCDFCFKLSLSSHRCSDCLTVQYCSTDCQKKDLEFHKSVCATWAKDKSRRIKGKVKQKDHWKADYDKE